MNLLFTPKEAGKAYVADRLWLPKSEIRIEPIKRALEFTVSGGMNAQGLTTQILMRMWEESKNHIICPREFLPASHYPRYSFPFIDLSPGFQKIEFRDLVVPRDEDQERAWKALASNDNGILNLACGKGKTKLALKKIAQRKTPTLVIVPDGAIMEQWKESILGNAAKGLTPGLEFDGELGIIQGPVFNWAKPLTLALVTTLWIRIEQGAIPEEFFRYFGQIIYDEVHIIGAPKFSLTASPFYGDRIGLTATVKREDGLDPIYRYHLGEPFYTDLSQEAVPRIYFQQTPVKLDHHKSEIHGTVNTSVLRTMLGRHLQGNIYRYWSIKAALDSGRKLLCISHSKDQLKLFHAMFPGSALIIGETEKSNRMNILRDSKICFAIAKLGSQGVDDDRLDTLFWLTPYRSKIALQQSMGRIQRRQKDKKDPVVVTFEDWTVPPLKKLCAGIKSSLREWGYPFEVLKPMALPEALPVEIQAAYDAAFSKLPERGESDED
jgi:superfamily II DNA or RNA helicase